MKKRAIVVGAGIGGLAAAVRLQHQGYSVTVFEKNDYPGGKLGEIVLPGGYRFDTGPSLFTMPQHLDAVFESVGRNPRDYYRYHRLDPICRYFWEDGTRLDAFAEPEAFAREAQKQLGEPAGNVRALLRRSAEIYDITHHVFLERSLHRAATYLRPATLRSLLRFPRIDPFRTMDAANRARLTHPKLVQLFNRYATYNGSDPYQAPATLNVIPHLEFHLGAYLPEGGLVAIPRALHRLGKEMGVQYHWGEDVAEITYQNRRVSGVRVGEKQFPAEVIVSNADVVPTYRRLLPRLPAPERSLRQPRSSSAVIFYWGMNRRYPTLDVHNIFFSEDYADEFAQIWRESTLPTDPTIYLFVSSNALPGEAPPDHENWFLLINAPADRGQQWTDLVQELRRRVIEKLERVLGEAVASHIVAESVRDPAFIESWTSSYRGALYGTASNNRFAAFLRHPNFSRRLAGLYFVGGSVHPGGGIPLSLLSAKIVAEDIGGRES